MIAWLAVVNSALAFTLWNHTQRYLAAAESSLINNTMLIQITFLAWVFLREPVGVKQALGLGLAAIGAAVVQLRGQRAN
jgi:drug/metabolite transporter (DMT)-like permease